MSLKTIVLLFVLMTSTLTPSASSAGIEADPKSARKVLVVYFSRSGNTQLLAQEIANYYQASLLALEAKEYPMGLRGLLHAVADSQETQALISPEKTDLSAYDTLFIGAPIWRYSPAPPVWQFIDNNKLANKKVVLFSTFNSGFKQKYIDEFQARVEAQGGSFISHLYIKRGRMLVQISSEALLVSAREELEKLEL
jgi:flavodoxin